MPVLEKIKIENEREIRILNNPFVKYGKVLFSNGDLEKYFDVMPSDGLREVFFDELLKKLEGYDFDDVYVYRMRALGDAYMLSFMIDDWFMKNKSQKPIIVFWKQSSNDLFKILKPKLQSATINYNFKKALEIFRYNKANQFFVYKGKRFFSFINKQLIIDIHNKLHLRFENSQRGSEISFFLNLSKHYGNIDDSEFRPDLIKLDNEKIVEYAKNKGLNLDKFVFLTPECSSNISYDSKFWLLLIEKLKNMGYGIYMNSYKSFKDIPQIVNDCPDLRTTYTLASKAKSIIGIRSGINDLLSTVNVPQHLIYTRFKCDGVNNSDLNIQEFSLKHLPKVNKDNIYEYSADNLTIEDLLNTILKGLEN